MQELLQEPLFLLFLGLSLGLVLGVLLSNSQNRNRMSDALEKGKEHFEKEKNELSGNLAQELGKMRLGIAQSIDAYQGAVRTLGDFLPISDENMQLLLSGENQQAVDSVEHEDESQDSLEEPTEKIQENTTSPQGMTNDVTEANATISS